jgi:hypothetical protein
LGTPFFFGVGIKWISVYMWNIEFAN